MSMRYQYHLLRSHHVTKTKIAVRSKGHKLIGSLRWSVGGPEASLLQKKLQHSNESIRKKTLGWDGESYSETLGELGSSIGNGGEMSRRLGGLSNAKKKFQSVINLLDGVKVIKKISVKVELSSKM